MPLTIIVPLDGSTRAEQSLVPLPGLARAMHAKVALLMASTVDGTDSRPGYLERLMERHHLHDAAMILDDRQPVDAILHAMANHPGSVVWLPTHARSGVALVALGGIAEQVVTSTTEPVILVGPHLDDAWTPGGPVVLAYDGSPHADTVLEDARRWSELLDTTIHVVTVAHHDGTYVGDAPAQPVRKAASDLVARIGAEGGHATAHFLDGLNPATAIPHYATSVDASLIMASAHTHHGIVHATLGSVAIRMARHSTCPVLVRRSPDLLVVSSLAPELAGA